MIREKRATRIGNKGAAKAFIIDKKGIVCLGEKSIEKSISILEVVLQLMFE